MQTKQFKNFIYNLFITVMVFNSFILADPESGCDMDENTLFLTSSSEVFYNSSIDIGGLIYPW